MDDISPVKEPEVLPVEETVEETDARLLEEESSENAPEIDNELQGE